jgi:NADH:ubiquinone oxidoreductase subunit 6 (subunit J)
MRWIVLFYGGIAVLILVGRILWFVLPEVGTYSRTPARLENRVQAKNLLILIVPVVLIVLTVRLWLQTR